MRLFGPLGWGLEWLTRERPDGGGGGGGGGRRGTGGGDDCKAVSCPESERDPLLFHDFGFHFDFREAALAVAPAAGSFCVEDDSVGSDDSERPVGGSDIVKNNVIDVATGRNN